MFLSDLIHYSERFEDTMAGPSSPNNSSMSPPITFSPNHPHLLQSPTPMSSLGSAFTPMQQHIAGGSRVIAAPLSALPFSKFPLSSAAGTPMSAKQSTHPGAPQPLPLINFVKRQYIASVMDNILRHQARTYELAEDQHLYAYVESRLQVAAGKDQGSFWLRSQEVQQAEVAHADIRRGLEQAGF